MTTKTQTEIDEMMALPSEQRPAGWAWWMTQEQADAADEQDRAGKAAQAKRQAERDAREAAHLARLLAAPAKTSANRGLLCGKCHSYCYGDCAA